MNSTNILISLIISIVVLIGLFLLFRSVLLWFWKIDKQVELQTRNNKLLESILLELKTDSSKIDSPKKNTNSDSVKIKESEKERTEPEKPKESEKEYNSEIKNMIDKLKKDELIIQDKKTDKFSIIKTSKYETDKELHLSHTYKVIYQNDK